MIRHVVEVAFALLIVVGVFELTSMALQRYRLAKLEELSAYCLEKGMNASLSVDGSNMELRCVRSK